MTTPTAYLLDTCVISELVQKSPHPRVVHWIDSLDPDTLYLSVITLGEIQKGIDLLPRSKKKTTLTHWLQNDLIARFHPRVLPLDLPTLLTWGTLQATLESLGRPMPTLDSLLAATALTHHLTFATRNTPDFHHVPHLPLLNPWP